MERRKPKKRRFVEKRGATTLENRELATDAELTTISVASTTSVELRPAEALHLEGGIESRYIRESPSFIDVRSIRLTRTRSATTGAGRSLCWWLRWRKAQTVTRGGR